MNRWHVYSLLKAVIAGETVSDDAIKKLEGMNGAEAIEGIIEFLVSFKAEEGP